MGHLNSDLGERRNGDLRASHRAELLGQHEIKAGLGLEEAHVRTEEALSGGVIYDFAGDATRFVELGGGPGYTENCGTPEDPDRSCRFLDSRVKDARTKLWTSFLQDSWSPIEQVTVKAGVRLDRQEIQDRLSTTELAPRVGAAYDWTRKGRSRSYVYWGRAYESVPLSLNTHAFDESTAYVQNSDGVGTALVESTPMSIDAGVGGPMPR